MSEVEERMKGRRMSDMVRELQKAMPTIQQESVTVDWVKIFKASFMLLFVAYPGASRR